MWNDPTVGIDWPLDGIDSLNLSEKDTKWDVLSKTFHF